MTDTSEDVAALGGYHHLNLTVRDIDRSAAWYIAVLGFENVRDFERPGFRRVFLFHPGGQFFLGLTRHDGGAPDDVSSELRVGMDHVAFTVSDVAQLRTWERRFAHSGVEHSEVTESASGALLTFRDPDNIQLELHVPMRTLRE